MGVLAHQKRQLQIRKKGDKALVPDRSTFGARWPVPAVLARTRITKSHGENRYSRIIVELRGIELHPVAKSIAARIIPRDAALMGLAPWRLADNQQPRRAGYLKNRPRSERQARRADPAATNFW